MMRFRRFSQAFTVTLIVCVLFALETNCTGQPVLSQDEKTTFIPRACIAHHVNDAPKLDGLLTDKCWESGRKISNFVDYQTGQPASPTSSFWVVYDDKAIYLGIDAEEPVTDQLVTNAKQYDGSVFNDDCFELFFQPDPDQSAYYHLVVNADSVRYDSLDQDKMVDISWSAVSLVAERHWTVEVKIPFSSLRVSTPQEGGLWRVNVCRSRQNGKTTAKTQQYSCWSRLSRGYHEPEGFGHLVFDDYRPAYKAQMQIVKTKLEDILRLFPHNKALLANAKQFEELAAGLSDINNEQVYRDKLLELHLALQSVANICDGSENDPNMTDNLPAEGGESLVLSKLDPYEPFLNDRVSQLAYIGKVLKEKQSSIKLNYIQAVNEYEHDAFVISAQKPVSNLWIRTADLISASGERIPAGNIQCSMVGYLKPETKDLGEYLTPGKDDMPELVEEIRQPFSLKQMESRHIWITVNSIEAQPGNYKGVVEIGTDSANVLRTIPIEVKIWPFELPQRPKLDLSIFTGIPWGGQSGELWAKFLTDHYVTYVTMDKPVDIYVDDTLIKSEGTGVKDMELGMDLTGKKIRIIGEKWDNLERLKIIRKYGLKLHMENGRGMIQTKLLPAYIEYLKNAGFGYEDFRYKISDENFDAGTIPIYKAFRQVDPQFQMMFCPAGDWDISPYRPYVNSYMCSVSVGAWETWLKLFQKEQAFGKKFAVYTNGPSWAGRAPVLQGRKDLHWIWKIHADEYTVWTMDIVPELNYAYGYTQYGAYESLINRPTENQALATLVYFRKDGEVFRPVSCKRLEAIRDGVKDWMYLNTLSQLMGQVEGKVQEDVLKQCRTDIERFVKPGQKTQKEYSSGKELLAGYIMKFDELLNPYNQKSGPIFPNK